MKLCPSFCSTLAWALTSAFVAGLVPPAIAQLEATERYGNHHFLLAVGRRDSARRLTHTPFAATLCASRSREVWFEATAVPPL
jgi:hypothetical protein